MQTNENCLWDRIQSIKWDLYQHFVEFDKKFSKNNFFYCDLQDQIHSQIVQQKLDSTDHYKIQWVEWK